MKTTKDEIAGRIKQALDTAKVSQRELSKALNVSEPSVSAYTSGKSEPSAIGLAKISELCGVSIDWIVTGKEPNGNPAPITYQLNPRDHKVLTILQEQLELYGLDKRFYVKEIHHILPPKIEDPDIQEITETMAALDPEYRADVLKYVKEKKMIQDTLKRADISQQLEAEKQKALDEVEEIRKDLSSGELPAIKPKRQQVVVDPANLTTKSVSTITSK